MRFTDRSTADDAPFSERSALRAQQPIRGKQGCFRPLVRSFVKTYGLPVVTTNCSNNYGPYQFPEKLIPLAIHCALAGKAIPVYGDGQNIRDWLYVSDHCAAIERVLSRGRLGRNVQHRRILRETEYRDRKTDLCHPRR